jgi:hypothetical protein
MHGCAISLEWIARRIGRARLMAEAGAPRVPASLIEVAAAAAGYLTTLTIGLAHERRNTVALDS